MGEVGCFRELVARLDGLFLTGAASNVDPEIYDGEPSRAGTLHDPARDATTLPLITAAIDIGVPVFAVCRGIQELNVALGGTLHQNVHELPGKNEHRMNRSVPSDERFEPRHPVTVQPGGLFEKMVGDTSEVMVNSLHAQAIDQPGDGLFEGVAGPLAGHHHRQDFVLAEDVEVLARYLDGQPAVTSRDHGAGRAIHFGTHCDGAIHLREDF